MDTAISGGSLHLTANQESLWYQRSEGPLVYKETTGNFVISTRVRVRRESNPSVPVGLTGYYQFGGLMVRDPYSSEENYVFLVVGERGSSQLCVEGKSTRNGSSDVVWSHPPRDHADIELRICRVNSHVSIWQREIGDSQWMEADTQRSSFGRGDLPSTVQVGLIVYASDNRSSTFHPNVRASFDYFHYEPIDSVSDCTQ